MSHNYLGLVLSGGQSRRMGQDKALLPFGKMTLFEHVLQRFDRQINDIIISTRRRHGIFNRCGRDLVCDIAPFERLGPLSGLYAAFDYCQKSAKDYDAIITVAVDTPFFPDDYVFRLCHAAAHTEHALIATTQDKQHPTFACWPTRFAPILHRHLKAGKYSILSFAEQVKAHYVSFPDETSFFNVNTPQEWALAHNKLAMLRAADGKRTN